MSAVISVIIRLLGLCGVSLSPFAGGAILAGIVAAAIGAAALHLYDAGYGSAEAKCETAALESELKAVRLDQAAARKALGDERLRNAAIEQQAKDDQEGTAAYVEQLKKSFKDACALDDNDLRGLRAPAGGNAARPRASAGSRLLDAAGGAAGRGKGR